MIAGLFYMICIGWGAITCVWSGLLVAQLLARRRGLMLRPTPASSVDRVTHPTVTVIVPVRNEQETIERCLRHILGQDYRKLSVIVVDDRSSDRTAAIVGQLVREDSRLRVERVRALPPGWLAKSHALWCGARAAETEWLLFVDADCTLHPAAVRTAIEEAQRRRVHALTLWPRNAAVTFWEHMLIPLCAGIIALWFGSTGASPSVSHCRRCVLRPAFANGQFLLIGRSAYFRIGGHAAVRDSIIEDIPLAEQARDAGVAIHVASGCELLAVRMYHSLAQICDGWSRIYVGALRSGFKILLSILWLLFGSLLPHIAAVALVIDVVTHGEWGGRRVILAMLCVQHLALLYVVSVRFWRMGRCRRRYLWLYPISVVVVTVILARSLWLLWMRREIRWRETSYSIDARGQITTGVDPLGSRRHEWRRRAAVWCAWLLLAGAALVPLQRYRVDNSIDGWLPELSSRGPFSTYVVVGREIGAVKNEAALDTALRRIPEVAFALDRQSIFPLALTNRAVPENLVVAEGGDYVGTFCFGTAGTSELALIDNVRRAIEQHDPSALERISMGGPAAFKVALDDYSQRGMPAMVCAMFGVGALALRWVTGSWGAALTAVAAVAVSQVILLGLVSSQGRAIDMSLSIVPPLLMSLGFSYAAHRALRRDVAPILVVCGITAAAGVASSALAPLSPMRLFGMYGTFGLLLVWLSTWTCVPLAATRVPRTGWLRAGLRWLLRAVARPRPVRTAAVTAAMLAVGAAALPLLAFQSDPLHYFPASSRIRRDFEELDRRLTGMLPFQITIRGDARTDARPMISASAGVRSVVDISELLPNTPGQTLWCLADNSALPELSRQHARWQRWAQANGVQLTWRGVAAQLAEAELVVMRNAAVAIPSMCLLGGVGLWLVWRRAASFALGAIAAILPVAAMVAVLALARVPMGLPSLFIGAICIGLSIDDTLHLAAATERYQSVRRAMIACFRPCVGSSLTNALCALMFIFSPLEPVRQFGLLTAAAVVAGMLVNQLLVPQFLSWRIPSRSVVNADRDESLVHARAAEA